MPKNSDINYIIAKTKEMLEKGYDKVYSLFDLDVILGEERNKKKFDKFKKNYKNDIKKGKIVIITSNPCFELWFLYHFKFVCRDFYSCKSMIDSSLKKHISNYSKKQEYFRKVKIYEYLRSKLEIAVKHSKQSCKNSKINNSKTNMYKLIYGLGILKEI